MAKWFFDTSVMVPIPASVSGAFGRSSGRPLDAEGTAPSRNSLVSWKRRFRPRVRPCGARLRLQERAASLLTPLFNTSGGRRRIEELRPPLGPGDRNTDLFPDHPLRSFLGMSVRKPGCNSTTSYMLSTLRLRRETRAVFSLFVQYIDNHGSENMTKGTTPFQSDAVEEMNDEKMRR